MALCKRKWLFAMLILALGLGIAPPILAADDSSKGEPKTDPPKAIAKSEEKSVANNNDKTDNSKQSGDKNEKSSSDKSGNTAPKGNPYIPRQGMSAEDLQAYIQRMQESPETIRSRPGFAEGMAMAAERILESKPTGTLRTFAMLTLLDSLHQWADSDENKEADEKLAELSKALVKDPDKKIAAAAEFYALEQRVLAADKLDQTKLLALLTDEKAALDGKPLDAKAIRLASATVHAINRLKNDDEHNRQLKIFGDLFAASKDLTLSRYGKKVAQTGVPQEAQPKGRTPMQKSDQAKTSDGVGQPLELTGTTTTGEKFKLEPYKGKVVLVLFWATWCPDCMAAMPGIKELYQKHKAEGFEIVGVDLDPQAADLRAYIEKEKIGWTNLVGEGTEGSLEFPMAVKYEITGTPSSLLVDVDGKIVARNLEGEALAKKIDELLKARSAAAQPADAKSAVEKSK